MTPRALLLLTCAAWPATSVASGGLYFPPHTVIVGSENTWIVARLDQEADRWVSLCREDARGAFEFDVRGPDPVGPLFEARLHRESSGGFAPDYAALPEPHDDEDPAELPLRFTSVSALEFQTSKLRDDESDTDFWQVKILLDLVDDQPRARVEAARADRDGNVDEDAESARFEIGVKLRPGGECRRSTATPAPRRRRGS